MTALIRDCYICKYHEPPLRMCEGQEETGDRDDDLALIHDCYEPGREVRK